MFWKYVREAAVGGDEEASGAPKTGTSPAQEVASDDLSNHWKAEPSTLLKSSGGVATAGERPKTSAPGAGTAGAIGRLEMGSKRELLVAILNKTNEVFVLSEQDLNARYRDRVRPLLSSLLFSSLLLSSFL